MAETIVEIKNLDKSFGDTHVLKNLNFSLLKGEIHGLVGENGAGKSTLMNILSGLLAYDRGQIYLNGQELHPPYHNKTIGMVHQHFMIAPPLTPLEHVLLEEGRTTPWYRPLPRSQTLISLQKLSQQMDLPVRWNSIARDLPLGELQRVEILRVLALGAEILIFDEPTAVLTPQESLELQKKLLHFKSLGHSIILISHKLKEVLAVADRISVLRQGQLINTKAAGAWGIQELGEAMIGRNLKGCLNSLRLDSSPETSNPDPLLTFDDGLGLRFKLKRGEILGIAGVEGNGQEELVEALANPRQFKDKSSSTSKLSVQKSSEAKMIFAGSLCLNDTPAEIRKRGIGFLFADRHQHSVINSMTLQENYFLGNLDLLSQKGWLNWSKIEGLVEAAKNALAIKMGSGQALMSSLSGGSQQKFVVERETYRKIKMLVAHQPTRGVDLGAIELIQEKFIQLRNSGVGILLISSDLDELFSISDRIVVLFRGRIQAEFSRQQIENDPNLVSQLGLAMGGKA